MANDVDYGDMLPPEVDYGDMLESAKPSKLKTALGHGIAGATMRFSDELGGIGTAIGDRWANMIHGTPTKDVKELYTEGRDEVRADLKASANAHPGIALGSELAVGLLAPGIGAVKTVATLGKVAAPAIVGGVAGLVSGVGGQESAEGETASAEDMAKSGGLGLGLGAVGGVVVGKVAGAVAKRAGPLVKRLGAKIAQARKDRVVSNWGAKASPGLDAPALSPAPAGPAATPPPGAFEPPPAAPVPTAKAGPLSRAEEIRKWNAAASAKARAAAPPAPPVAPPLDPIPGPPKAKSWMDERSGSVDPKPAEANPLARTKPEQNLSPEEHAQSIAEWNDYRGHVAKPEFDRSAALAEGGPGTVVVKPPAAPKTEFKTVSTDDGMHVVEIHKGGKKAGTIALETGDDSGRVLVSDVTVEANMRRQGVATELYEHAAQIAAKAGKKLGSAERNESSTAFWEAAVKRGKATKIPKDYGVVREGNAREAANKLDDGFEWGAADAPTDLESRLRASIEAVKASKALPAPVAEVAADVAESPPMLKKLADIIKRNRDEAPNIPDEVKSTVQAVTDVFANASKGTWSPKNTEAMLGYIKEIPVGKGSSTEKLAAVIALKNAMKGGGVPGEHIFRARAAGMSPAAIMKALGR